MSYSIWTTVGDVRVASKREADALAEIKGWGAAVAGGVVGLKLRRAQTLDDAFAALGFTVDREEGGRFVGLDYEGQRDKLFDDLPQLFAGIARFVIMGSELEFKGEEGERYCFRFDGRRCRHEFIPG